MKNILLISGGVLLMTPGAHAEVPPGSTNANPPAQISPAVTAPSGQELGALRAQEKTLKTRIALMQDNINTYKSWFGHPLTPAQRIDTQDKIDRTKVMLENYQTQLAAVQSKIKGADPTATSPAAATPDPKWPFKH